jgi:hypothetical protein
MDKYETLVGCYNDKKNRSTQEKETPRDTVYQESHMDCTEMELGSWL